VAIGAGWAEGSWVDASWVVGAWEAAYVAPTPDPTKGGSDQPSKQQLEKEHRRREDARAAARKGREEMAKLFPIGAAEELAATGKLQVAGFDIKAPKLLKPTRPASMAQDRRKLVENLKTLKTKAERREARSAAEMKRVEDELRHQAALAAHKLALERYEEEFIAFMFMVLIDG